MQIVYQKVSNKGAHGDGFMRINFLIIMIIFILFFFSTDFTSTRF